MKRKGVCSISKSSNGKVTQNENIAWKNEFIMYQQVKAMWFEKVTFSPVVGQHTVKKMWEFS